MGYHDPRREIEKLRERLASHDLPISFLIGAGASCAVSDSDGQALVPAIRELGTRCEEAIAELGANYRAAYDAIVAEIDQDPARMPATVEDVLSSVRWKIAAMSDTDCLAGATRTELESIEERIRTTIATAALPEEARIPTTLPHHALADWLARIIRNQPVELFTTNYDVLLERALEDKLVPFFDGFVGGRRPFFASASLLHEEMAPARAWARLWKIHGSVTWTWQEQADGSRRIARGSEGSAGELIFPSLYKYDESRKQPYVAILDRLARALTRREGGLLIAIGYSFSDQHINEVLFEALDIRPTTHVVALQYTDPDEGSELDRRARRHHNLLVYGPERAIIGGTSGSWHLLEEVDYQTADLLDVPFDSDAVMDDSPGLTGRFRLGDFVWFCRFLEGIASKP